MGIGFLGFIPQSGLLDFMSPSFADSVAPYYSFKPQPDELNRKVDQLVSGQTNFTRFEPRTADKLGIVEGTFNFSVIDTIDQTTYHITDGEFRFRIQHSW